METNKKIDLENISQELLSFFETLLEKKGVGDLPPDILAEMIMDLYGRFNAFVLTSVMQKMDPEKYADFDKFMEREPAPEESQKFLEENVPNLPEVVQAAMKEFADVYLGDKK